MNSETWISAAIAALMAGFAWIVRTVLTNNKRVELLQQSIDLRTETTNKADDRMTRAMQDLTKEVRALSTKVARLEGKSNA